METIIEYLLLSVLYMECLMGLTVNVMIVAANFLKWKSQRSLQTRDKILSHLAISRGLFFVSVFMVSFFYQFFPWLQQNLIVISIIYIHFGFIFQSSLWIVTILCVFYCVKIVSYNCAPCIFLRSRISTMVSWLVAASFIISFISSLPFGWHGYGYKIQNIVNGSTGNMTENGFAIVPNYDNRLLIYIVGSFPPFVIFCAATSLLIHFLLIHTRRMRSVTSQNVRSHFGALKSMSLFLVLQILFFIFMSLMTSSKLLNITSLKPLRWIVLSFPFLIHSLYLFSSSSDLRKMFISKCLSFIR